MLHEIKWMCQGLFYLFITTSLISLFYSKISYEHNVMDIILISVSLIFLFINYGEFLYDIQKFENMNKKGVKWFLYENFVWGVLAFLHPLWKLFEASVIGNNLALTKYSFRIFHLAMFMIYINTMYNKIPKIPKGITARIHESNIILNISTFIYSVLSETLTNVWKNFDEQYINQNITKECINYTGPAKIFCQGLAYYETFFYSFCVLSIFLLINILKKDLPEQRPSFYKQRNSSKVQRGVKNSLVGIFVSIGLIVVSICNYVFLQESTDYFHAINMIIYIVGCIASVALIFEMMSYSFLGVILSKIDHMIIEFGTIGQLVYLSSMFLIALFSGKYHLLQITYFFNILQVFLQRVVIMSVLKVFYDDNAIYESNSSFLRQLCPSMILMTLNLSILPTILTFNKANQLPGNMDVSYPHLWAIFTFGRGPVLSLHRLHGSIVFGYTLYQNW